MRRKLVLIGLAGLIFLTTPGCYPGGPESLEELGLVITFNGKDLDFTGMSTFGITDAVADLDTGQGSSDPIDPIFKEAALEAIEANMISRGFTLIGEPYTEKPDVWITVGAVQSDVWVQWYGWGYYGGYPGWGGGYYPPYTGVAKFEQGSIIWQMLDLRDVDDPTSPDAEPTVMWLAGINGAVKNSQSANVSSITSGVGQGFTQSPYIKGESVKKLTGQEVAR